MIISDAWFPLQTIADPIAANLEFWNLAVVPGNYVIFVNNENNLNDIVLLSGHIFISF